jgi:hypothetical protein
MAKKRSGGGSNVGLITTLIFFILATIGLGVTTYLGFAEQEAKDKAVAEAKKNEELFKSERDWYKTQAQLYRLYLGSTPKGADMKELARRKTEIDKGQASFKSMPDKEDALAFFTALNKDMPWDGSKEDQPRMTMATRLKEKDDRYATLKTTADQHKKDAEDAKAEVERKVAALAKAEKKFKDELEASRTKSKDDFEAFHKDVDKRLKAVEVVSKEKEDVTRKLDAARKEAEKEKDLRAKVEGELTTTKANWKKAKDDLETEKARVLVLSEKAGVDKRTADAEALNARSLAALKHWRKDWKIVVMDRKGTMPYINLGSADRVVPQLSFSIHAVGFGGKLDPTPKGTLEVVRVLGPHLSRARITSTRDPRADPILKGDKLFNLSWDPSKTTHVVVAGVIDLAGDGRDGTADFLRALKRQGIVVDAYIDLKKGTVAGKGLTSKTDYLIVGDGLDSVSDARARNADLVKSVEKAKQSLRTKATTNGVTIISYKRYLDLIGYRTPRVVDRPSGPRYR